MGNAKKAGNVCKSKKKFGSKYAKLCPFQCKAQLCTKSCPNLPKTQVFKVVSRGPDNERISIATSVRTFPYRKSFATRKRIRKVFLSPNSVLKNANRRNSFV